LPLSAPEPNTAPHSPGVDYAALRNEACRLLARREYSAWELRCKLQCAAPQTPQMLDRLLAELVERGAQSDLRFAEQRCRRRYQDGRGPVKLLHELAEHRIDEALIERVMSDYQSKWRNSASEVRRRKFGDQAPASYREWARQARFLQQRGFDAEHIEPFAD